MTDKPVPSTKAVEALAEALLAAYRTPNEGEDYFHKAARLAVEAGWHREASQTVVDMPDGHKSVFVGDDASHDARIDDKAHTEWARANNGTGECRAFYIDFDTKKPYPCNCGYVASLASHD